MKKFLKILLIIALIAGVAFVGYKVYERFWANKVKEMDAEKGWEKYKIAANKSLGKEFYNITYSKDENDGEKKTSYDGYITVDEFGHYHEWEGTTVGSEYIVKLNNGSFASFTDDGENKVVAPISNFNYATEYKEIENEKYLNFLTNALVSDNDKQLKSDFYLATWSVSEEEFKHTFGETKDGYVWETKYTCVYIEKEARFSSELTRKVYFDNLGVQKVVIEKTDRQIDETGKRVSKGTKKTFNLDYEIKYDTNQTIVKTDFSEYPSIG